MIDACSDALYEYIGKDIYVGKRTVQLDIQFMRSDELGYQAPTLVYDRNYYTYQEEDYNIANISITKNDMNVLTESVEMLSQFKDFSLFSELNGIIQKLEDKIHTESLKSNQIIHLEKNINLTGLQYLDSLH